MIFQVKAARIEPGGRTKGKVPGGYISVDGEVVARGHGSLGNQNEDLMNYDEAFEITVEKALATVFAPN